MLLWCDLNFEQSQCLRSSFSYFPQINSGERDDAMADVNVPRGGAPQASHGLNELVQDGRTGIMLTFYWLPSRLCIPNLAQFYI